MIGKLENQLRNANQRQAKESGFCPLSFVLSCFVGRKRSALPPRHNPLRQQKSRKIMRLSHHRHKRKSTLLNRGLVTERSLEGFPVSLSQFFYRPVDGFSLTGTSSLVIVQVFPRWLTLELKPFGTSSSRADQLYFSFCHCNPLLSDSIRFGQDTKLTAAQPQKNCCYAPPAKTGGGHCISFLLWRASSISAWISSSPVIPIVSASPAKAACALERATAEAWYCLNTR